MAKANDVELEIVEVDTASPAGDYLKLNKLGKVPTFEGQDGYVLYECMAIAIYSKKSHCLARWRSPYTDLLQNDEYCF